MLEWEVFGLEGLEASLYTSWIKIICVLSFMDFFEMCFRCLGGTGVLKLGIE